MKNDISARLDSIDEYVITKLQEWNVPGISIAVVKDGDVILSKGYGSRNINKKLNVTNNTLFAIGSASKAFTSMAAGILADEGKLDFDTPIKKYIPGFKMYDSFAEDRLTVRDMLCHRSGLSRHEFMWYNSPAERKELVNRIQYLEPNKDFRTVWQYNNPMYVAVGYLIEVISGMKWEEFVKQRILEPLGMKNSNFSIEESKKQDDYSLPYSVKDGRPVETNFRNIENAGPAGSINSNIEDMTKWLKLQLNKGSFNGKKIVSETVINQMHTPQIPCRAFPWEFKELQLTCYGLGWFVETYRGMKMVSHGGNIDGFSAFVSFLPDENTGIVILSNLNNNFLTNALSYEIYDRLFGYQHDDWSYKLKTEVNKVEIMMEQMKAAMKQHGKENTKPSHKIDDYTGKFENPGYGAITITRNEDNLEMEYNNFKFRLNHHNYDVFTFEYELLGVAFPAAFVTNYSGDIDSISIPFAMDPAVSDIIFKKI